MRAQARLGAARDIFVFMLNRQAVALPISMRDVLDARDRLSGLLPPTPLRSYASLDRLVGHGIRVWIKHENHHPTNSFKARNGAAVMTHLSPEERRRGVVAATRGNHGLGLAWAGALLSVPVTICVPLGNNPDKNDDLRGLGASLIESGRDYDEAVAVAQKLSKRLGLRLVHATNSPDVLAGAATMALEILEKVPDLDALVLPVGGGSQAVGALTVIAASGRTVEVYAVQAEAASAAHDSWRARRPLVSSSADTIADGLATRQTYPLTFPTLRDGLSDFVTVSEAEIAESVRILLHTTHNLAEGAGATALAGLLRLRPRLVGKKVAVPLSGSNIDAVTLRRITNREI